MVDRLSAAEADVRICCAAAPTRDTMSPVTSVRRLVDLLPRAVAILAAVAGVLWGLGTASAVLEGWGIANWLGAVGILSLVTPVVVTIMASVNYAFVSLLLWPVRRLLQERVN